MKLHEVITTVQTILADIPELAGVEVFADLFDQKRKLEEALQTRGLALVLIQESGSMANPGAPDLLLQNLLIVSIVENPKINTDGPAALATVGLVLKAIHQHEWNSHGLKNALTVDNPAYTRGELDSGLVTYFCNFLIKTIE